MNHVPDETASVPFVDLPAQHSRLEEQLVEGFRQAVESVEDQDTVLFLIRRGGSSLFAAVTPKSS